jgi:hypothetical protein
LAHRLDEWLILISAIALCQGKTSPKNKSAFEGSSDRVEEILRGANILLPWPVFMETYTITLQKKGRAEADRRYALIRQLKANILWEMDVSRLFLM